MFLSNLIFKLKYFKIYVRKKRRIPNIFFPKDYSEFIFKDIFFRNNDDKFILADKYRVREIIKQKGLEKILPELYGVWENASDINFNKLPKKFVLKTNHSCATNIICTDKSKLNILAVKENLNLWMKSKHPIFFETHYDKILPVIICEELISDNKGDYPIDYKIHCTNGKPVFIQCCYERTKNSAGKRIILDTNWEDLNFVSKNDYHFKNETIEKPKHLTDMLKFASILSEDLKYARIDFYDTEDQVFFSEITLTPMGGFLSYFTQEALNYMGKAIRLKTKTI